VTKIRLDELRAALAKRGSSGGSELKESDYKRKLVWEINRHPEARARRIEDRFAVGVLDLIIKMPDRHLFLAEGKVISGFQFGPTPAQFEEGKRWEAAGVRCILIGWKMRQMYVSAWTEMADSRKCFTVLGDSYADILWEFTK
jgi:hypothetical protein